MCCKDSLTFWKHTHFDHLFISNTHTKKGIKRQARLIPDLMSHLDKRND